MLLFLVQADNFKLQPNRGERKTLQPNESLELTFNKAEKKWRFAIFQVHAQKNNATLSLSPDFGYGMSVTGANVAVLFPFPIREKPYPVYLKSENKYSSYQVDVIGLPYEDGGKSLYIKIKSDCFIDQARSEFQGTN